MNSNKKYDFYKNSIYYLISSAIVLGAGIIVASIWGFNYNTSIDAGHIIFASALSIIISLLIIYIYVGIRYDFAKAFSIVLSTTHNVLLATAFIAIIRVPVSESLVMGYILLVGLTTVYTLVLTENLKDVNLKKADYNQIISTSLKNSLKLIVLLSVIVIALLLLSLLVASTNMFNLTRVMFVMMLVLIYSSLTIILPLWCYFSSKIKKVKKAKVDENIQNQKVVKAVSSEQVEINDDTQNQNLATNNDNLAK